MPYSNTSASVCLSMKLFWLAKAVSKLSFSESRLACRVDCTTQ